MYAIEVGASIYYGTDADALTALVDGLYQDGDFIAMEPRGVVAEYCGECGRLGPLAVLVFDEHDPELCVCRPCAVGIGV